MKMLLKYSAALMPLFAACLATAADDAATKASLGLPVVTIQAVTTEDTSAYVHWVEMANEKFKAAGGPDNFTHVYQGILAGDETGVVYAVRLADSAVAMAKASDAMAKMPERAELMGHLNAIRKLGAASMLQAIRFEGGYDNEWVLVTDVLVKDEGAYLKGLGELRALLDSHDMKDIKLNVYRVIAGRSGYSHKVVITAPSHERCAAMLDGQSTPWMSEWLASLAPLRTVVHNGVYQKISK